MQCAWVESRSVQDRSTSRVAAAGMSPYLAPWSCLEMWPRWTPRRSIRKHTVQTSPRQAPAPRIFRPSSPLADTLNNMQVDTSMHDSDLRGFCGLKYMQSTEHVACNGLWTLFVRKAKCHLLGVRLVWAHASSAMMYHGEARGGVHLM